MDGRLNLVRQSQSVQEHASSVSERTPPSKDSLFVRSDSLTPTAGHFNLPDRQHAECHQRRIRSKRSTHHRTKTPQRCRETNTLHRATQCRNTPLYLTKEHRTLVSRAVWSRRQALGDARLKLRQLDQPGRATMGLGRLQQTAAPAT